MVTPPMLTETEPGSGMLSPQRGHLDLVRALLLVQIGVIVTATIESAVFGLTSPTLVPLAVVNGTAAIWTMVLLRGIGRRSERARRWTIRLQIGWIALAGIDLLLAALLTDRSLEPVPSLTRAVLPLLVIGLLRARAVRIRFGTAS